MDEASSDARANPHAAAPWSMLRLCAGTAVPQTRSGLGILWPQHDVRIAHAGREFDLRAGDLVIVDRTLPLRIDGGAGWAARLLDFGDRRIAARVDDRRRFVALPLDGTTQLGGLLKRMWAIGDDIGTLRLGDDVIDGHLTKLLADLGGKLIAQAIDMRLPSQAAATVERARMLIDAHLADPDFGVAMLADRMRISSRHLSSLFASLGTTTSQAILEARLDRGKALLGEPAGASRQIAGIARACGFEDQGYFARRFRERFGVSPRIFREHNASL